MARNIVMEDIDHLMPQEGETIYVLTGQGTIYQNVWTGNTPQRKRWYMGFIFLTAEQAELQKYLLRKLHRRKVISKEFLNNEHSN